MPLLNKYKFVVDSKVQGIPCKLGVKELITQKPWKGSAQTASSDLDYTGYTEVVYDVLDRKGYQASWLTVKITEEDEKQHLKDITES